MHKAIQHGSCKPLIALLGAFLLCLASVSQAQKQFRDITRYSTKQGVTDAIFSVVQDPQGFIWLGTSSGLVKYDGYQFTRYSNDVSSPVPLQLPAAGTLFIDSQLRFWIGSWGDGIAIYTNTLDNVARFIHDPNDPTSLPSNFVQTIFEDSQGNIWLGSNGGGLSLYDPNSQTFSNFTHDPDDASSISHNRVWSIIETEPDYLWVATNNGLNKFSKETGKFELVYNTSANDPLNNATLVRTLFVDIKGRMWVGTETGVGIFDQHTHTYTPQHPDDIQITESITIITQDHHNNLLIATQRGLYYYDIEAERFIRFAEDDGYKLLLNDDIRDIMVQPSGLIWLGTRYAGLIKINTTPTYQQRVIKQFTNTDGMPLPLTNVTKVYKDRHQTLWICTLSGLYYRPPNSDTIIQFDPQNPGSLQTFNTITEDQEGSLWVTGDNGLYQIDRDSMSLINQNHLLSNLDIKAVGNILASQDGSLWIGTWHSGLMHLKGDEITLHGLAANSNSGLQSTSVTALFQDSVQRVWVGTDGGGLSRLDPGSEDFVTFIANSQDSGAISNNMISAITEDSKGRIWIGTNNQLNRYDTNTNDFISYDESDGISSSNIRSVIEDDNGHLWVGTSNGIFQLKQDDARFHKVSADNGIQTNLFRGSVYKDRQGRLYFGGQAGLSIISPASFDHNVVAPNIHVTDIWIDNKRLPNFSQPIKSELHLNHSVKNIKMRFIAMDYSHPKENQFSYRLIGFDHEWSQPSNQNWVSYTNLYPGSYSLQVKASVDSTVWSNNDFSIAFTIHPPWWDLWWFKTVLVIVFLGGLYLLYRFRINTIAQRNEALENTVRQRTEELNEQKKELLAAYQTLERNNLVDELTQLHNRKFVAQHIGAEIEHVNRVTRSWQQQQLTDSPKNADLIFFLIDLDDFKSVNDCYGHAAGDAVLKAIRPILQSVFRNTDFLVRWGGEEFLVIAKNANRDEASALAERLRQTVHGHEFIIPAEQTLQLTVSIGYVCYPFFPLQTQPFEWYDSIQLADCALYAAKRSGRNAWVGLLGNEQADPATPHSIKDSLPQRIETGQILVKTSVSAELEWV